MDAIITKIGLEQITKALELKTNIIFKEFVAGDGNGTDFILNENAVSLINQKYIGEIKSINLDENHVLVECVIPANTIFTEGFYIRELGLFDDKKNLIVMAKVEENYRPSKEEIMLPVENNFIIQLTINSSSHVEVAIKNNNFASGADVIDLFKRIENLKYNSSLI